MRIFALLFIVLWFTSSLLFSISTWFDDLLCLLILLCGLRYGVLRSKAFLFCVIFITLYSLYSFFLSYNSIGAIIQDAALFSKPYLIGIIVGAGYVTFSKKDTNAFRTIISLTQYLLLFIAIGTLVLGNVGAQEASFILYKENYQLSVIILYTNFFSLAFMTYSQDIVKFPAVETLSITLTTFLTGQSKYLGFVLLYLLFLIFFNKLYKHIRNINTPSSTLLKHIILYALVSIPFILIYISLKDIDQYYLTSNPNVARAMMLRSLPTALDGIYSLFGRGFASYCTPVLSTHYSSFMDEVGLSSVYGLSTENGSLIADGYYWSLIGQTGLVGLFSYIAFFLFMLKPFFTLSKASENSLLPFIGVSVFSWCVIFSIGSGLFWGYGPYMMIILGMARWHCIQIINQANFKR